MKITNPFYLAQKKAWEETHKLEDLTPEQFVKSVSSAYERAISAFLADMPELYVGARTEIKVESDHRCDANLSRYEGLLESYNYCTICDKKFK